MLSSEIRQKFLDFFKEKGHKIIPSASLIPEHDPSVLFTTAGMHPLVPYLMGEPHPEGRRLVNFQKCLRTVDIDEVGDSWHLTFFEMLGNWSLGDYFKEEAIKWSFEFLTEKKWLGIDKEKLSVSVFAGDDDAPRDEESAKIWQTLGIPKERIFYYGKKENWWGPAGQTGPCGPCTEMFYDTGREKCGRDCQPKCNCGKYVEIWNDVFMEYNKTKEGKYKLLVQKNVDTGMGLERMTAVMQGKDNVYETELFGPIINSLKKEITNPEPLRGPGLVRTQRIIADHIKAAVFLAGEGILPSNIDQGYVLRRILRRAIKFGKGLFLSENFLLPLAQKVIEIYQNVYPGLNSRQADILTIIQKEEEKFEKTLSRGLKEFEKLAKKDISGEEMFYLYESYGFPVELTEELAKEKNLKVDIKGFNEALEKHREISRAGAERKFKGGLSDHRETTVKYHTATHLLHQALRQVLGEHVKQQGSNITPERLRFDFSHPQKITDEELKKVEEIVNQKIKENLKVERTEMEYRQALKSGALAFFKEKYPERVSVYSIGDFSKEICAGPHVSSTSELGHFKIVKEESSGAGVRRIRAILE